MFALELKGVEGWTRFALERNFTLLEGQNTVDRISYTQVSTEEFIKRFERPRLPVVIRGSQDSWQASKKWNCEVSIFTKTILYLDML